MTIEHETSEPVASVRALATEVHAPGDMAAAISSGSFPTDGMIIAPCSMRSLGGIANGVGDSLIMRAADVSLKERRKLVLLVRETPLHEIHLQNMLTLARMGAVVLPPMPAFYNAPQSVEDIVDHVVARALDQFGLQMAGARRWNGRLLRPAQPA
jgi:4-hydroxy-3-polyprenylbenzoate decarboxylase